MNRATELRCLKEQVDALAAAIGAQVDLDEQTLDVNCDDGTLDISNGNSVDLADLGTKLIYRYTPPTEPGLRALWWGPDAGPHIDPLEWAGTPDPDTGFLWPTTVAPDFDVVNNSTNVNDSNSGAGAARYGIIKGWVLLPDGVTHWRDNNANTGELGMVLTGGCCGGALTEQPGGNHTASTTGADRTLMDPTPVDAGWHYVFNPQSDSGAFAGLDLEFSSDDGTTWSDVAVMQPDAPTVEVSEINACDDIPDGWQIEPLTACCQPRYTASGGIDEAAVQALIDASATPHVEPATAAPIPDNEVDTAIRTGIVGTSADYARADHNHPIRRQAHPDWPGVTTTNVEALNGEIVLDRRSTEEWVEFEVRVDMNIAGGNNWPIVRFPAIAGYQQPIITVVNTYRNQTQTYQLDDQPTASVVFDGAAPVGPYMGIEASHWSSTRGVYFPFRRENPNPLRWFLIASVKYVRS